MTHYWMQNPCTWTSSVARFPFLLSPPPPSAHTTSFHHQHLLRGLGGGAAEHRAAGGCSISSGTKPLQKMPRGGGGSPLAPSAASSCLRFLSVPETLNIFIFLFSFGNQARQTFFVINLMLLLTNKSWKRDLMFGSCTS